MSLSASQTEGNDGSGSGGSGYLCTNSVGKFNFFKYQLEKSAQIHKFFTYCLQFGTKLKYLIWFMSLKNLNLNIYLLP